MVVKYGRRHTLKTLSIDATHGQRKIRSPSLSHTPSVYATSTLQQYTTMHHHYNYHHHHWYRRARKQTEQPVVIGLSPSLSLFFSPLSSCLFSFVLLSSLRVYQYGRNIFFSIRFYSVYFASFFLFFIFGDILDETPDKYLSRHIYIRPTLHDSDSDSLLFPPFFSYF